MTIIFITKDLWIEYLRLEHGSVATATNNNVDTNLEKPGRFVGGADSINFSTSSTTLVSGLLRTIVGVAPLYGEALTAIRSRVRNDSGVAQTITHTIILFLKN